MPAERAFRVVHAADCHLDAPCRSLDAELRRRVDAASRTAFERLVALAIDHEADCLLVAGDLFDRDLLRLSTEAWLPETLAAATAAGVAVIVVTGNHDPGEATAPGARIAWPSRRFQLVRSRTPQQIDVHRPDGSRAGVVVAAGHEQPRERANLAATFPTDPAPDVPVVGLLHAQVYGYEGEHDRYAPCAAGDLARPGYDYWALGHVHRRQPVLDAPAAWYAGNLQSRHFGDPGAKGALVVDVVCGQATVAFEPLAPIRWESLEIADIGDVREPGALLDRVERRFDELAGRADALADQQWVLRLGLRGSTPLHAELRGAEAADDLSELVRQRLGVLAVSVRDEGIAAPVDVREHVGAPHLLGVALDLLERARYDDAVLAEISPTALAAAPADPAARAAYLRALLDGLDVEAVEALLQRERGR